MNKKLKTFIFIYEDKDENELQRKELDCYDRKDAEKTAFNIQQNSMLNDLANIRVQFKPIKWARKCSKTGQGMDQGYCFVDGEAYFIEESDALEYAKSIGYKDLDDAYKADAYYYTTWEDESDFEYFEDENGELQFIEDYPTAENVPTEKTTLQKAIEALKELEKDETIIGIHLTKKFVTDKIIALEEVNDIINNTSLKK